MKQILALFLLLAAPLFGAPLFLSYPTDIPVKQISHLEVVWNQQLSGMELSLHADQMLEATVAIAGTPLEPPFDMIFTLKDLTLSLRANHQERSFSVQRPQDNPLIAQLSLLRNHPIRFPVDQNFKLEQKTKELTRLMQEIPLLEWIEAERLLADLLEPAFALAGKTLTIGTTYTHKRIETPQKIQYTITSADEKAIYATIQGKVATQKVKLGHLPGIEETVHLKMDGDVEGEVTWSRENALNFQLQTHHTYKGELLVGELVWPFQVALNLVVEST